MEAILLRYLVFSAITAALDSRVVSELSRRGLVRDKSDLLSTSAKKRTFKRTYKCRKRGRLDFVLAFEDLEARLKLKVTGPNGEEFQKEGTSTFSIEVPVGAAGDWHYEVTALEVPFANFPFTVTIASEKR